MDLSRLKSIKTKRPKKRLGRGIGSGKGGHTVGRGTKGQKARSGARIPFGFEGGQVPLYKRLPQIGGFKSHTKKQIVPVALGKFNVFSAGTNVKPWMLVKEGIVKKVPEGGLKILAKGRLKKEINFKGFLVSKNAIEEIKKAGGKVLE